MMSACLVEQLLLRVHMPSFLETLCVPDFNFVYSAKRVRPQFAGNAHSLDRKRTAPQHYRNPIHAHSIASYTSSVSGLDTMCMQL